MSEYPSDWRVLPLGEVAEVVGGGTPSRDVPAFWGNDHYWITPSEVVAKDGQTADRSKEQISDLGLQSSGAKLHPPGTILMTSRASIGFAAITQKEICTNQGFQSLRCGNELDNWFALHQIRHRRAELHQLAAGSTFLEVSGSNVRSFPFILPPLPEQKKIDEILSGIDNQMELLQKGVKAKQNLRSALLSELIAEDAPITKLDSVASRVSGHTPSKSHSNYWNGGIPWISLTDTSKLDNRYISHTAKEISKEGIKNSSAVLHPPGLVILSRDARVGCSAITTKSMAVSQHFVGWICSEKLLNKYLYYLLQKWKPKFEAIAMGSTIPTIGVPFFRDLEIPVPPMVIQERISETLESVDREIEALSNKVAMLRVLKSGVSSDLLSGRKRVSV